MRKIPALLTTLALAGLGALVPTTGAQAASAHCDDAWHAAASGSFYAYDGAGCYNYLGRAEGNDSNWGNLSGGFQRDDTNRATSILHKGTSGMAVSVYVNSGYTGQNACLKKSEYYVSNLGDNYMWGGNQGDGRAKASNTISSHKWVWESACSNGYLT